MSAARYGVAILEMSLTQIMHGVMMPDPSATSSDIVMSVVPHDLCSKPVFKSVDVSWEEKVIGAGSLVPSW